MNNVTSTGTSGTKETPSQQDIKKLLSIKMPDKDADFSQWKQYNEQQYGILLIPGVTEEDKKTAIENLLNANTLLFHKRAKEEKLVNCGLEYNDVIQIETLNFIEAITKAAEEGVPTFPSGQAFDKYRSKRKIWESYSPCGLKVSYATKKRMVANNTYNFTRLSYIKGITDNVYLKETRSESKKSTMLDSELFGDVWLDELRDGLDSVLRGLSDIEVGILIGIANGLPNVKIASGLGISETSVRRYTPRILAKARAIAIDNGLDAYIHDIYA